MAGRRGPRRRPTEEERRLGNPGHRSLPAESDIEILDAAADVEPLVPTRALGPAGQDAWDRVWTHARRWLAQTDVPQVQAYCEAVDDYVMTRNRFIRLTPTGDDEEPPGYWRLRKHVNDARTQVTQLADALGLTPTARAVLGVAEVRVMEGFARLTAAPVTTTNRTKV